MALVQLDSNAVEILSRIVKQEEYKSASDAIRHLENQCFLQKMAIEQQEKEIQKRDEQVKQINDILAGNPQIRNILWGENHYIKPNPNGNIHENGEEK